MHVADVIGYRETYATFISFARLSSKFKFPLR